MQGITAYSAYLPAHRVDRGEIGSVLAARSGPGDRVVAGHDEDTTTMGVAAATGAVRHREPGAVWFATTRPAYLEKTNAALIHAALGLSPETAAYDVAGALRSGAGAMVAALRSNGIAVVSDLRIGLPESAEEAAGADGAAAFAFGEDGVIAEVLSVSSATVELLDRWRLPESVGVEVWDDRFSLDVLGSRAVAVVADALKRAALEAVDHVVVSSANPRLAGAVRAQLGATPGAFEQAIGFTGAAHAGLLLADVLDRAEAGDTVLVVSLADGVDAMVLRTTDLLPDCRQALPLTEQIATGCAAPYAAYLTWRGLLTRQPPRRPDPQAPAGPPSLRDGAWKHALVGNRCTTCSRVHMPPQRVCSGCGASDRFEDVPMAGTRATVATFTIDRLAYSMSPPVVIAVVDMDGGGRFVVEVTDLGGRSIAIGDRLEPTFRRLATSEGIHNYFWKMRPVRGNDGE